MVWTGLFGAEGDARVDLGGAEGGEDAGRDTDEEGEEGDGGVGVGVGGGDAPDLAGDETGQEVTGNEADCDSEDDQG